MKLAGAGTAFEVPLYRVLARAVPERVLTPIAVDVERAWLLLPDGGSSLGERDAGLDALVERSSSTGGCSGSSSRRARRCSRSGCRTCGRR